jgi:hypothetical protein
MQSARLVIKMPLMTKNSVFKRLNVYKNNIAFYSRFSYDKTVLQGGVRQSQVPTGGKAAKCRRARVRKLNRFDSGADGIVRMGEGSSGSSAAICF